MPQQDQEFFDFVLDTVTHDAKKLGDISKDFLDSVDTHVNVVVGSLRDALQGSPWIPSQIKPPPPPPPPRSTALSDNYLDALASWASRHRAVTAALVAFLGTGAFLVWHKRRLYRRVRKARRAASGAKTEVVVLVGSPYAPLTRSVAAELDNKGFLVFLPVSSVEEETAIADFQSADVRPLNIDITSESWSSSLQDRFSSYLANPQRHGTKRLHLASVVILEAYLSSHSAESIHSLSMEKWTDAVNTHVLYPISLINTFMPLLYSGQADEDQSNTTSSIVLLTPSAALAPQLPGHATESLSCAALQSYVRSLQIELPPNCQVVNLRLGALKLEPRSSGPDVVRQKWASKYQQTSSKQTDLHGRRGMTRDLRHLSNAVFDAAAGRSTGTVFVGRGARTYAVIGAFAPDNLVSWMRGFRSEQNSTTTVPAPPMRTIKQSASNSSSDNDSVGRSTEWEKVTQS